MFVIEGWLPFLFLPIWWFCIRDHPREAKWISAEERTYLETTLQKESADREPPQRISWLARLAHPSVFVMMALYFLHNCAAYGCMTFFTNLKGQGFTPLQYGLLFAVPYAVTAVVMVINSWHSDKTRERRGHVAAVYFMSGTSLILSVVFSSHFWISYALLCLAIPGPFAAMAPFWAIPGETLPRSVMGVVMGLVNAVRQPRRLRRFIHRRLAGKRISQHRAGLHRAGHRDARLRRAGVSAAEIAASRRSGRGFRLKLSCLLRRWWGGGRVGNVAQLFGHEKFTDTRAAEFDVGDLFSFHGQFHARHGIARSLATGNGGQFGFINQFSVRTKRFESCGATCRTPKHHGDGGT